MKSGAEIKVGLFVLMACAALAYMTLKVGGGALVSTDSYGVDVFFDNASGLKANSPVEIAGIEVGQVESIGLDDNQARVRLRIRPDVRIRADAAATIRTRGVLGDKFIEIQPGSSSYPTVSEGGKISKGETPADLDELLIKVGSIADDIAVVARSVANVFGGPQGEHDLRLAFDSLRDAATGLNTMVQSNAESVGFIVDNFRQFSTDLRDISSANKAGIDTIIANLEQASAQLNTTMEQAGTVLASIESGQGPLGALISDREMGRNMRETMASLERVARKLDEGQGTLGAMINDPGMGEDLQGTMASLESVSRKIDEGKGTLGRLVNDETTADELDQALEGLNKMISKQDQFRTSVDFSSEYLARHEETKSALTLRLQPSEDKYYLLSVVDNPRGKREKTDTTIQRWENGQLTTIREIEDKYRQSKVLFSAQLAKRWDNLVLRGGLIESSGGLGLEYYLWDDRLQLLFEAYDFDPDENPHLKAGAKLYFLRNFYASLGMDDFARSDRRSFYAGLGFYFTDEDLKYLLTSAPIPGE